MLKSRWLCGALTAMVCAGTPAVAADLLAHEGFDYAGTALNEMNGGTGWSGGWLDGDADFAYLSDDDTSMTSPAIHFAPVGDRWSGPALPGTPPGGASEAVRALGTTGSLATEGLTWYMSGLFAKNGLGQTASENLEFSFTSTTGSTTQQIRWGMSSDDKFFVDIGASPTTLGSRSAVAGETYFLVAKLVAHATDPDVLSLWVYGEGDTVPLTEPDVSLADTTVSFASSADLAALRLIAGNNNDTPELDELRIGLTWSSAVVPEPAGLLLMVAGGWTLVRRRMRRAA